jgi:polysaccharide pyruvyl transferase WcaK-like protein
MSHPPRVGLFGILGSGNLGNDGSLDAVVTFLRERYPGVRLDFMCMGPETMTATYGAPATALQWYEPHAGTAAGARAALLKIAGKLLDPFRTLAWVRRQDVVIVPGMGVLEATLPLRPWAFPYSLFWLAACARLTGAKVALVSVGASVVGKRLTRAFITRAARLAHYRSYRDALSRDAMRKMGVDVSADEIYPDLAFALPVPPPGAPTGVVGVGVMAYYGGNDDRARADELHDRYVAAFTGFVRHLVDNGRSVRLFTGDRADAPVVEAILADLRAHRPALESGRVVAAPLTTLHDLIDQMSTVDTVVATRYHNVLCALKLAKPTLSIGYAAKNDVLMAGMGLAEFCQPASSVDLARLIAQFDELESRREPLTATLVERNRATRERLEHQFTALSATIPGGLAPARPVAVRGR